MRTRDHHNTAIGVEPEDPRTVKFWRNFGEAMAVILFFITVCYGVLYLMWKMLVESGIVEW